jgi:hypothetical protein
MIVYSFTYHHKNGSGSRTAWYVSEKEAMAARRVFIEKKTGAAGSFVCLGIQRHTVNQKHQLISLLSDLTNGYEIDKLLD